MSDTTTSTAATDQADSSSAPEIESLRAEVDKWKALARQNENAFKRATKDTEDAVTAAREEGRTAALREAGASLVNAEFRAAAAGRDFDLDAILESIDVNRFMNEQGQPKTDAITALIERVAPRAAVTAPAPAEPAAAPPQATAFAQAPTTTPPGLNQDNPLLAALKANLGIN